LDLPSSQVNKRHVSLLTAQWEMSPRVEEEEEGEEEVLRWNFVDFLWEMAPSETVVGSGGQR
jgi:hypothetical protein